jgi:hypothetical protein
VTDGDPQAALASLLDAAFAEDFAALEVLRREDGEDWWTVALTLAYLLRDVHLGRPEAVALVRQVADDAGR